MKKERDIMPYGETKVYFDGSHYIAIPHTEKPYKRRPKKIEEVITVADDGKTLAPVKEKAESPPVEEKQITLEDLAEELGKFNENIIILERLAMAIEKQNELLEQSTKPKIRTLTNEPSVFNVTVTNNKKSE